MGLDGEGVERVHIVAGGFDCPSEEKRVKCSLLVSFLSAATDT